MTESRMKIYADSIMRTKELGNEFDLPYSEELDKAILLINQACSDELKRRKKNNRDIFIVSCIRKLETKKMLTGNGYGLNDLYALLDEAIEYGAQETRKINE